MGLDRNPTHRSAISKIPIPQGIKGEVFTPSPLSRPLGLRSAPQVGENSPLDTRTLAQKRADLADVAKSMERRQVYLRTFFRPYFQEWRRVDHHKGKSFVSNERLFKKEKALYFPNIWGQTLAEEGDGPDGGRDTTPALKGMVTVVGMQSGQWAEEQVKTFVGAEENPRLQELLDENDGKLQRVDVNVQGDIGRAMLVKLFQGRIRKTIPKDRWDKYFMVKLPRDVRLGLTDDVRDAMGFLNTQVGYVYLLDQDCKIRWAGSGHAWPGETDNLNNGVQRLLEEFRSVKPATTSQKEKIARIAPFGTMSNPQPAAATA